MNLNFATHMTMFPYSALPAFLRTNLTYRLHRIRVTGADNHATATIYDGEQVLHTVHDRGREDVIKRAKEWIDEQDEYDAQFDLHRDPFPI